MGEDAVVLTRDVDHLVQEQITKQQRRGEASQENGQHGIGDRPPVRVMAST